MRFKLKNVGVISEADILLDNITLIAAENDSGNNRESTIYFNKYNELF